MEVQARLARASVWPAGRADVIIGCCKSRRRGILPHYSNAIGSFRQIRVYQSQHPQVHRLWRREGGNRRKSQSLEGLHVERMHACLHSIIPLIACQFPSMRRRAKISAQIFERSTHSIASVLRVKGGMNLPANIHTHTQPLGNHSSSGQLQRSQTDARIGSAEFPCVHPRLRRRRRRSVYKHRHAYKYWRFRCARAPLWWFDCAGARSEKGTAERLSSVRLCTRCRGMCFRVNALAIFAQPTEHGVIDCFAYRAKSMCPRCVFANEPCAGTSICDWIIYFFCI